MWNHTKRLLKLIFTKFKFWFYYSLTPVIVHIKACYNDFDPILDVPPGAINLNNISQLPSYRKYRENLDKTKHKLYILPFCLFVFTSLDSLYQLYKHDFVYDNQKYPIPELLSHKIYPNQFWEHGDVIIFTSNMVALIVYWNLWTGHWLDDKYFMYLVRGEDGKEFKLIVDGKVWNSENSHELCEFRRKSKRNMKRSMTCTYCFLDLYFFWNYLNKSSTNHLKYYFDLYIFLGIYIWYCHFALIILFNHFYIASRYIIIKQKHFLKCLDKLAKRLRRIPNKRNGKQRFNSLYRAFLSVNRQMAYQCSEIRGYNRFWGIYITCQFGFAVILVCYMAYGLIFVDATLEQTVYFVFFLVEMGVLIFAVIFRCSVVDFNNSLTYKKNVHFCIMAQFHCKINHRQMVNIEKIATNRNFSRSCFRLRNNYRLDSTAFNLALYIISTFFMMICRKNNRKLQKHVKQYLFA